MERVTYLLGAGFSAPLGLPIMSNFLSKAKDMYFGADEQNYRYFRSILGGIDKMAKVNLLLDLNLYNIEDILSLLEMERFVRPGIQYEVYRRFIRDVISYYTPKLSAPTELLNSQNIDWIGKILGQGAYRGYLIWLLNLLQCKLSRLNQDGALVLNYTPLEKVVEYQIVTLNYDLVVENMIGYMAEIFHPQESIRIDIAKLHGSVDGKIIPPTWNKQVPKKIQESWKVAYEDISNTNHLRIIGYSMPTNDNHMKYLLSVSLKNCPNLKSIDVITRDSTGETKARYDRLLKPFPYYHFRNATVEDYFDLMFSSYSKTERGTGEPPFQQYIGSGLVENESGGHFQANAKSHEKDHAIFMKLSN
jgi:hypothetical protein